MKRVSKRVGGRAGKTLPPRTSDRAVPQGNSAGASEAWELGPKKLPASGLAMGGDAICVAVRCRPFNPAGSGESPRSRVKRFQTAEARRGGWF